MLRFKGSQILDSMRSKNVRQRVFFLGGFEVEADGELGEFVHLFCLSSFSKFVSATTEQPIIGWMINDLGLVKGTLIFFLRCI